MYIYIYWRTKIGKCRLFVSEKRWIDRLRERERQKRLSCSIRDCYDVRPTAVYHGSTRDAHAYGVQRLLTVHARSRAVLNTI